MSDNFETQIAAEEVMSDKDIQFVLGMVKSMTNKPEYIAITVDTEGRRINNPTWFVVAAEGVEEMDTMRMVIYRTEDVELTFNQIDFDAFLPISGYTYKKGAIARMKTIAVKYGWASYKESTEVGEDGESSTKAPVKTAAKVKAAPKAKAPAKPKVPKASKAAEKRDAAVVEEDNNDSDAKPSPVKKARKAPVKKAKAKKETAEQEVGQENLAVTSENSQESV